MKRKELIVIIQDEIKNNVISGVYIVEFSDGHFYIGCSTDIRKRIMAHIGCIKGKPAEKRPRVGMERMAGFRGTVNISLLQEIHLIPYHPWEFRKVLEAQEWKYISSHCMFTKFLNKHAPTRYGKRSKRLPLTTASQLSATASHSLSPTP